MVLFRTQKRNAALVVGLIAAISILHYNTDVELHYFHEVYKVLYYIPIILSAFLFGVKGALAVSVLVTLIYIPHVMMDWTGHPYIVLNRFVEMFVFNVVGLITGILVEKERAERERYEQAATQLKHSYETLQQQSSHLAEVEEQLRAAERLATLGELTASLAHEVRNPLGAIRGAAEILQDDYPADGKNRQFAELLLKDVDRLNGVIENYLGLLKTGDGAHGSFDVVDALRTTVQLLQAKARKENKRLELLLTTNTAFAEGDETKFRQILLNLLLNAFAAIEPAGKVAVELAPADDSKDHVRIRIRDNGVGIPESELDQIFKPFYSTRENGTGLGLAIAQRFSKAFGWELQIKSDTGQGTSASLILPVKGKPA